jgi:hypothetical protein
MGEWDIILNVYNDIHTHTYITTITDFQTHIHPPILEIHKLKFLLDVFNGKYMHIINNDPYQYVFVTGVA